VGGKVERQVNGEKGEDRSEEGMWGRGGRRGQSSTKGAQSDAEAAINGAKNGGRVEVSIKVGSDLDLNCMQIGVRERLSLWSDLRSNLLVWLHLHVKLENKVWLLTYSPLQHFANLLSKMWESSFFFVE